MANRAQRLSKRWQLAFAAACVERALQGLMPVPPNHRIVLERIVESLWQVVNGSPEGMDNLTRARAQLEKVEEELDESNYAVDVFMLFNTAVSLALEDAPVDQVVAGAQNIGYQSVLQEYFKDAQVQDGAVYSPRDFEEKAAMYPEVRHELEFEDCIMTLFEQDPKEIDLPKVARDCSQKSPVLWRISY